VRVGSHCRGSLGFPKFPEWLGKHSTTNKRRRMLGVSRANRVASRLDRRVSSPSLGGVALGRGERCGSHTPWKGESPSTVAVHCSVRVPSARVPIKLRRNLACACQDLAMHLGSVVSGGQEAVRLHYMTPLRCVKSWTCKP